MTTKTSATSGTKPTGTDFNAKDICSIIKACKDSGVRQLEVGGLRVSFSGEGEALPVDISPQMMASSPQETAPSIITPMDREAERLIEEERLMLEDPAGYEQRLIDGTLDIQPSRDSHEASFHRRLEDDLPGRGSGRPGAIQ